MNTTRQRLAELAACFLATASQLAFSHSASAQAVADRNLSDIRVDNVGTCSTLTVNFNIRVQLVSYFPTESGRELHIRLRPLDSAGISTLRESLRTPDSVPALRTIDFEGDNPSGPVLSLFFSQDMRFEVEAGQDPQSLIIRISEPGSGPLCAPVDAAAASPQTANPLPQGPQLAIPEGLYVVNLQSRPEATAALTEQQQQALGPLVVYQTTFERNSQQWHRLRAGFYETRSEAEQALAALLPLFPDGFVVAVTSEERSQGVANRLAGDLPEAAAPVTASAEQTAEAVRLVGEAEGAIAAQEIDRAIQLLTNAQQLPENANTPRALELLGLSRERKGQQAQARTEYEEYLRRYPAGEAADRVRQRLAALTGAATPTLALREASGGASQWSWGVRGSFSQFYFRDQSTTRFVDASQPDIDPEVDNSVNLNQLLTAGDITISGGDDQRQLQLRASGAYTANFRQDATDIQSLTALYLDYSDSELDVFARVGRQTRNSAGVLGRFDGALLSWAVRPNVALNLVGGFPVLRSRQMEVLTQRPFYGASIDLGARRSPISGTVYWFDQRAPGGFIDRQAVGFETRVLLPRFNAFSIIDYDVKYRELDLGLLSMTYSFPDTSSLSVTADYRQSPLLTTHNALVGQSYLDTLLPVADLRDLQPFFTDAEIYQLANDRTYVAKSFTVTYSRPIVEHLQASVDFTLTDTGGTPGTPASSGTGEVLAQPASGSEFYYGLQLIGTGLLWDNDIYIVSGRYADTQRTSSQTVDFTARIPFSSTFRLSPRLLYGLRSSKLVDSNFSQFQPTMRLNYYPMRDMELELELGANFSSQRDTMAGLITTTSESGILVSAGYRLDF